MNVMKRLMFLLFAGGWTVYAGGQSLSPATSPPLPEDTLKSVDLKEVVVKAAPVKRQADRYVLFMPPAVSKDGVELLQQAPGVWLSDERISINGASGTKVYVDDREIKLTGEQLMSYLRSLRSENILRIEVLPMAGADKDADAQGGVIHIYMRRHTNKGLQGSLIMGAAWASSFQRYLPGGNINMHRGKWDWYASASGVFMPDNAAESWGMRIYPEADKHFTDYSSNDQLSRYGTVRAGTIFAIDTVNSIGLELEYLRQAVHWTTDSYSQLDYPDYRTESRGKYRQYAAYDMYSAAANYVHKLDSRGSVLKLIADFTSKSSAGNSRYDIRQQTAAIVHDTLYRSRSQADYRIATADFSWKQQWSKSASFQAGLKYTYTGMKDHADYEGLQENEKWNPVAAYGYKLDYNENIGAVYATYALKWKKWAVNLGVRGEYTRTSDRTNHSKRQYWDWFPHADLTYSFDPIQKWMLVGQYARHIERPAFSALNPNRIQTSDYSYMLGNPALRPTYIHRFSATLVYNYRYTLTVGGNLHRDLIREFGKQDALSPDISYITYENHFRENHWFVAISAPWQPTTWLNLTANVVGVRQCIKMYKESAYNSHFLYFGNAEADFLLPRDYSVEIQYSGASRLYSGNSEVAPYHTFNLRLRKKWNDGKWVATVGADNLFDRQNRYVSHLDAYSMESTYHPAAAGRLVKVSLTWNFNRGKKAKKVAVEKNSAAERSRLKEK